MNPKFSEGELVILQSPRFPEHNGEYTVSKVWSNPDQTFNCRMTGTLLRVNLIESFSYHFEEPLGDHKGREICFTESSLKKKQEPGEMDYKELMQTLKNSVLEWN